MAHRWPHNPVIWYLNRTQYISIPFTWNLPAVKATLSTLSLLSTTTIVGGPAVKLMPDFLQGLQNVTIGTDLDGALQRCNPLATYTTRGCPRACPFCAVPKIEGTFRELKDWPDLPIITDNNLLAASEAHLDKVFKRLRAHPFSDFVQGLDSRLMTPNIARQLATLPHSIVRMALDSIEYKDQWSNAYHLLRTAGIQRKNIRTYCLIGYQSDPDEAWRRCLFIERHKVTPQPMWYHPLDTLHHNSITSEQKLLGWTQAHRIRIQRYFFHHTGGLPAKYQPLNHLTSMVTPV